MARSVQSLLRQVAGPLLWANLAALIFIKCLLPLGSGGLAAITESLQTIAPTDIVRLTNDARRAAGLADLKSNAVLDAAAARKLDDMAAQQYFAHQTPDGRQPWDFIVAAGYRYRIAGENLGKGFNDPSALVNAWMNSPSHRANLVDVGYRDIGVAARRITLNGVSTLLVVQMFGAPSAVAAAPVPAATPIPATPRPVAAKPSVAPAPQSVSTQRAIAGVPAPVHVTVPASANVARIADTFNAALMAELAVLLALLTAAVLWTRFHPRAVASWSGAAAVLVLAASLPALTSSSSGFIF